MQAAGAHAQAIAFLQEYGYFLASFEELGTVDFGRGYAPWFNMGRPDQVLLLNGIPSNVELNVWLQRHDDQMRSSTAPPAESYAALMNQVPQPFASVDRSRLAGAVAGNDGQVLTIEVALQTCRACEPVGYMPVEIVISRGGMMIDTRLLPFKAP
jgi:hypothetical protein